MLLTATRVTVGSDDAAYTRIRRDANVTFLLSSACMLGAVAAVPVVVVEPAVPVECGGVAPTVACRTTLKSRSRMLGALVTTWTSRCDISVLITVLPIRLGVLKLPGSDDSVHFLSPMRVTEKWSPGLGWGKA